ncbi:glutathione S-transferase T3-like [Heracleum sosnowskyi]|uniref:Glutathione S-transferase T3-like n=1 Tax=Heracleum sosnowskyi TaxID=360622 RepID=A0AAD8H411_9APIA|nr:glutathione S-transferase T3-like [Heracleum sosnowskyi]
MDSQDPGHGYFTDLLNHDHVLDFTFIWKNETSPRTNDDSPPFPHNEEISAKKSVRGKATNKFCGKLAQVVELIQSGMTEQDKFAKAKVMYQSLENYSFQFEHCYHLLKNQPKWIGHTTKEDPKRRKRVSPSPSPSPISTTTQCSTATEDNVFENDVIELDRPIERKAEKGKRKDLTKQIEESVQLRKLKYTLLEESRVLEKEFFRLKAEKMKYDKEKEETKLRQEDERLKLECEKVKLAKKESDQHIMMMDVSGMPEMQHLYFLQL